MADSATKNDLEKIEVFPWNTNFDTGITVIDDQHKKGKLTARERLQLLLQKLCRLLPQNLLPLPPRPSFLLPGAGRQSP